MKKILKFLAYTVSLLLVVVAGVYAYAHYKTNQALALRYDVQDAPLVLAEDATTLAYGARLFVAKGCADCHGAQGEGKLVFDAGPVAKIVGPNLTAGGVGKERSIATGRVVVAGGVG